MHRTNIVVWAALSLACSGCLERALLPSTPCTRSTVSQRIEVSHVDEVDLLFLIDDSGSMEDEQRALQREIPRLVSVLASGDRDGDGTEDFRPVRSLHVGVVSSDLGAGTASPTRLGACRHGSGDDGLLRRTDPSCGGGASESGVFDFVRGSDPTSFLSDVSCVTDLGTGGCGLEQQLEASLEAVTPATPEDWTRAGYTPPRFLDPETGELSRPGHALGANAGFLRPGSVLAVVLVTDEEDCSAADTAIFGDDAAAAARFGSDVQLRCTRLADPSTGALHAVQRYVDGLLGLRTSPGLLVFSAIVGLPSDLVPGSDTTSIDFAGILGDPRMRYEETGERENFLRDACTRTEGGVVVGSADPARRIVETAAGLSSAGASVSLSSICEGDFGPAIDGVIARIADALRGACLPRDLNADADGRVDCEVLELLPAPGLTSSVTACALLPGRELVEVVTEPGSAPRELCRVAQLDRTQGVSNAAPGWFYDDASADRVASCGTDGQRISFTDLAPPATGSEVRLECLQTIALGRRSTDVACDDDNAPGAAACEIGMFCTTGTEDRCGTGSSLPGGAGLALACDPVERLCAAPCESDADCRSGGLLGFVCDLRSNAEAAGPDGLDDLAEPLRALPRGMCVNPTCN